MHAPHMQRHLLRVAAFSFLLSLNLHAGPSLPAIFGDNMVLQRDHANPVWGWAEEEEKITVSIGGQSHETTAGADGNWQVKLKPMKATGKPLTLSVKGDNELEFKNILIGEVWICSGQSNMGMSVNRADDADLEILSAKHPNLRIISIPPIGTQQAQKDFKGQWEAVTPTNAGDFSAVGYFFGRQVHRSLDVPVGLIDNAWGGSACEAWIRRDLLEKSAAAKPYMQLWRKTEAEHDPAAGLAQYEQRLAKWKERAEKLRAEKKAAPKPPRKPRNPLTGQHRPANLYNGVLKPIIGYGIRGAIWYQGENNSSRAKAYRTVFPLMIQNWRDDWKQGDFPFYWVQLADFRAENPQPEEDSWPELREAQTLTLDKLPNVGQAVIIDIGEGRDIHPRNKQVAGRRLARLALAKDYGLKIPHESPRFKSLEIQGSKATVSFDKISGGLYSFDTNNPKGFAICGEDRKFVWAEARIKGKSQVELWAEGVKNPVAVRYAWANNPDCTLYGRDGAVTLPVTPFRTDDFPMVTEGK